MEKESKNEEKHLEEEYWDKIKLLLIQLKMLHKIIINFIQLDHQFMP